MSPTIIDFAFAAVVAIGASLFEHYWFWPRFRAAVAAGDPDARVSGYRRGIIGQWLFTVLAALIWTSYRRPFSALRLTLGATWQVWLGVGLVAATLVLAYVQQASILRLSPERRVAIRPRLSNIDFVIPHTPRDHRWFVGLSLTAGFCEEFLYRGYLTWVLSPWLGTAVAMFVVVVAFGLGHSYQGKRGVVRATIAGVVMAGIVIATNSLVPAMIVHALVDISSGTAAYLLVRDPESTTDARVLDAQPI